MRLELALTGAGTQPEECLVSRMCEEFHCGVREALRDLRQEPVLVAKVLDIRSYLRARERVARYRRGDDRAEVDYDEMQMVDHIQELANINRGKRSS